ncbi:MAG: hypothetical protein AB8B82_04750 [Roseovarius sp.]
MPLTKDFKDTIKARAERDPEFRAGLFREAIVAMLSAKGNPLADNLLAVVSRLKQRKSMSFTATPNTEIYAQISFSQTTHHQFLQLN